MKVSRLAIRPRFQQDVNVKPEVAQEKISDYFVSESSNFEVKSFPNFMCLRIPEPDRHFWSPRLNLSFEEESKTTTRIQGVYGPNANVWGIFLYGYLITGALALIGGILGISQWAIGSQPWAIWIFGVAFLGIIALYFVARGGRRLGAPQTLRLHRAYQKAIGQPVAIR